MICMTLDCVRPTQFSVSQIISQCWSEVFFVSFTKTLVCYIVKYAYFTYISQSNVKTHLRCGRIYNNHIIVNCPQSVPVKNFESRSIIGDDISKSKVERFYWPTLYIAKL